MKDGRFWGNLWKYIFPILSIILWIAAIVLFFKSISGYGANDYAAQVAVVNATRWQPACFIGAIISTAAAYVVSEMRRDFREDITALWDKEQKRDKGKKGPSSRRKK